VRRAEAGTQVLVAETESDAVYIALSGSFACNGSVPSAPEKFGPGFIFGHASILSNSASSLTIEAASESLLLRLPRKPLTKVLMQHATILARLSELEFVSLLCE
jgi:CRP-like cAMP-binding protein